MEVIQTYVASVRSLNMFNGQSTELSSDEASFWHFWKARYDGERLALASFLKEANCWQRRSPAAPTFDCETCGTIMSVSDSLQ